MIMKDKGAIHTMVQAAARSSHFPRRNDRVRDEIEISVLVVLTIVLYAAIFIGLYHWNRHAPIFAPDDGSATTSQQVMPWPWP
jgi:hypothetical protein